MAGRAPPSAFGTFPRERRKETRELAENLLFLPPLAGEGAEGGWGDAFPHPPTHATTHPRANTNASSMRWSASARPAR
jgi:hypothetical protein